MGCEKEQMGGERRAESDENRASSYAERHMLRSGPGFLFEGPSIFSALSRAPLVHIWTLVSEKHVLSLVANCFIDSLLDRQSYYKEVNVVEQCVIISAIPTRL